VISIFIEDDDGNIHALSTFDNSILYTFVQVLPSPYKMEVCRWMKMLLLVMWSCVLL